MKDRITINDLKNSIRNIPDFPIKGIMFKDITTALKDPKMLKFIVDNFYEHYKDKNITKVAGIEARGFIFGSVLAYRLNAGFVPVRKSGKLPSEKFSVSYELEYGTNTIEIHSDALFSDDNVLIHDDLLATGGTVKAAAELVTKFNVKSISFCFLCELTFLNGRESIKTNNEIFSLVKF